MTQVSITHTVSEFCLYTGVSEEDLQEIVGLGVIEPVVAQSEHWIFDEQALTIVHRAVRLRYELAIDWPGIAVVLNLLDENSRLKQQNKLLQQRLERFIR